MAWLKPPTAKLPELKGFPTAKSPVGKKDAISKWYDTAPWRRFVAVCLICNPICQHMENGEQCHELAKVGHHLVSPRVNASLFLDWQNIVCVCAKHHPGGRMGEPLNTPSTYAITQGLYGASVNPNDLINSLRR